MSVYLHSVGSGIPLSGTIKGNRAEAPPPQAMEPATGTQEAGKTSLKLNQLKESMALVPVVDQAHVSRVSNAVMTGSYTVNPQVIADKMIEQESQLP